jgi:hypothetical protein
MSAMRAAAIVIWFLFVFAIASLTVVAESKLVYGDPRPVPNVSQPCPGFDPHLPAPAQCPPGKPDPILVHCDVGSPDPRCTGN